MNIQDDILDYLNYFKPDAFSSNRKFDELLKQELQDHFNQKLIEFVPRFSNKRNPLFDNVEIKLDPADSSSFTMYIDDAIIEKGE